MLVVLTPWQVQHLAKPAGWIEGHDYIVAKPLEIPAEPRTSVAARFSGVLKANCNKQGE